MVEQSFDNVTRLLALFLSVMVPSLAVALEQPAGCAENASADTGQPVLFARGPLMWGLSTRPITYGQKLLVLLWSYNPSEEPLSVATCDDIDFFWLREIEVVDSAGDQVASRAKAKRRAQEAGKGCSHPHGPLGLLTEFCQLPYPRTPVYTATSRRPNANFARDLNEYYLLPPGRYFLAPTRKEKPGQSSSATVHQRGQTAV